MRAEVLSSAVSILCVTVANRGTVYTHMGDSACVSCLVSDRVFSADGTMSVIRSSERYIAERENV